MRLQLSPASLEDLARARDHYEAEREGLGQELLDEVERLAERIAQLPLQLGAIPGSLAHRGLCKRFPYMMVFLVLDTCAWSRCFTSTSTRTRG
jgi:hypothetical protein